MARPGPAAGPGNGRCWVSGCSGWASRPSTAGLITLKGRGKNERFHRTLAAEVFDLRVLRDLAQAQQAFDQWRRIYNIRRRYPAPAWGLGHGAVC